MGRPKKQPESEAALVEEASKGFGQKEADKLAASYIPNDEEKRYRTIIKDGEEMKEDKYDVIYVTSDKNVFFKMNEGEARSHANKLKLQVFEVKNDN